MKIEDLLAEDFDLDLYSDSDIIDEILAAIDKADFDDYWSWYDVADEKGVDDAVIVSAIASHININSLRDKQKLLKLLLTAIKEQQLSKCIAGLFNAVKMKGADWPELGIIEKSLKAEGIIEEDKTKEATDHITDASDRRKYIALRNMEADSFARARAAKDPIKKDHYRKMAQQHNDSANSIMNKYRKDTVSEDKIKGADGKACWKGYRYAGTKNGKDKCVKVNEMGVSTVKKGFEKGRDALDKLQHRVATSRAGQNWNNDVTILLRKIKRSNPTVANIAQKYIEFGTKHPKWQTFIITVLTALLTSGIAATVGGAGGTIAALGTKGLVDLTNNLLKGKKFTDAAIQAGLASGAGQIGTGALGILERDKNENR